MTDGPIKIDTAASPPPPKKRRGWVFWILAIAVFITVVDLIGVLIPTLANRKAAAEKKVADPSRMPLNGGVSQAPVDESQIQWISPTSGPPITLEYVPLGTQVILHLRPGELVAHPEGEKILAALGTWGEWTVGQIEEFTGAKLAEIETLLVALHRGDDGWNCTLRATFAEPRSNPQADTEGRATFLPAAGQGRLLVSCPSEIAAELKEQDDAPTILARDLERLLARTDRNRSVTLLMPGKFLDTEGKELFIDGGEKLITAFDALVPETASAVMLSVDWREHFFCELGATIVQNAPAHRFNAKFAEQLAAAEELLAKSLESNPPHPYGKAVEERLPAMLRAMSDYTRVSQDDRIALVRCYLPISAGHNLLLASRLRLSDAVPVADTTEPVLSTAERLRQLTALAFPKETLENALEMLANDAEIPIRIAGRDLQLEGITKNQTFAIDLRDRPAEEVLVEVLRRANPDREATGPGDPRQKLVYVLRDDAVIVTTRSAATLRGEELPEVFRVKGP